MASKMLSEFLRVARSGDYLILDTETTGLHDAEIVQIAIINQNSDVLLDRFVKPTVPIPVEATGVHGIDDAMVVGAFSWDEMWADVSNLLVGRNVIVYNADFDRKMLYSATAISGLPEWGWLANSEWYCAMRAFAEVYGSFNKYRQSYRWQPLSAALAYFGHSENQRHSALSDCHHTHFVIQRMAALAV